MKSIFAVPKTESELSSANQGIANMSYQREVSLEASGGSSFPGKLITFRWKDPNDVHTCLYDSAFEIDCTLTDATDNLLTMDKNIALGMNPAPAMFQSAAYLINDTDICKIDHHLAQVDTFNIRNNKPGHWMSTTGADHCSFGADFHGRQVRHSDVDDEFPHVLPGYQKLQPEIIDNYVFGTTTFGWDQGAREITIGGGAAVFNTLIVPGSRITATINGTTHTASIVSRNINNFTIGVDFDFGADDLPAIEPGNAFDLQVHSGYIYLSPNKKRATKRFTLSWIPLCLPIFNVPHVMFGGAKNELRMTSYASGSLEKRVVESLGVDKVPGTDFKFVVNSIVFKRNSVQGPRIDDDRFIIDMDQVNCFETVMNTHSKSKYPISVPPSTYALGFAFQDSKAGNNTLFSPSRFVIENQEELNLKSFKYNYGGTEKPNYSYDFNYDVDNENLVNKIMSANMKYNAAWNDSSSETADEFIARGLYLYFKHPKTASDTNTDLSVIPEFSAAFTSAPRLLVFSVSKKAVAITYANGKVSIVYNVYS